MKAASEGSEIHLTWPARIPTQRGTVLEITMDRIVTRMESGRRQSYSLVAKKKDIGPVQLHTHVTVGEEFDAEEQIIASVMPELVYPVIPHCQQYDFLSDLNATARETVYAAAKALGFLPEFHDRSVGPLTAVMASHEDPLLRLEAAAALARLGSDEGWEHIKAATTSGHDTQVRMESVLVLSEFRVNNRAAGILTEIANDQTNASELRAAASWGLAETASDITQTPLLQLVADEDENTAVHSIVASSRLISDENLERVLTEVGNDDRMSAGIIRAILVSTCDPVPTAVSLLQTAAGKTRMWLLYLLACLGRERCETYIQTNAPNLLDELVFFWKFQKENWTNRLDVADQMDFLLEQVLD